VRLLDRVLTLGRPGPYQIKAAINAIHYADETDWVEITALYDRLLVFELTSVVRLNRAVALGMWQKADAGLAALHELDGNEELEGCLHLARARFFAERGESETAIGELGAAKSCSTNEAEHILIERRIDAYSSGS
jgi:RNA polymerase sigma-70 factor (ECF subfamily)